MLSAASANRRFGGPYRPEAERAVRKASPHDPLLDKLVGVWAGCELDDHFAGSFNPYGISYALFIGKLRNSSVVYSSRDVERFSLLLPGLYDGSEHFVAKAGFFLSALIGNCACHEFTIYVPDSLREFGGIHYLGCENEKKVRVFGDAGWFAGFDMRGGEFTVHGNAGGYVGTGMSGGKIIIEGQSGEWYGSYHRGGEIHFNGGGKPAYQYVYAFGSGCLARVEGGKVFCLGRPISYIEGEHKS